MRLPSVTAAANCRGDGSGALALHATTFFWRLTPGEILIVSLSGIPGLMIGIVVTGYLAFSIESGSVGFAEARFYAPVPFLFWAAIRFGMRGASGAIVAIAFLSMEAALENHAETTISSTRVMF